MWTAQAVAILTPCTGRWGGKEAGGPQAHSHFKSLVPSSAPAGRGVRTSCLPVFQSVQQEGCWLDKRKHFQAGWVSDPSGSPLGVTGRGLRAGSTCHCLPESGRRESHLICRRGWLGEHQAAWAEMQRPPPPAPANGFSGSFPCAEQTCSGCWLACAFHPDHHASA